MESHSLTWYEAALIDGGGVRAYFAYTLPPKGLQDLDDIGGAALRERAQALAERGLSMLTEATSELARLLPAAAELEPPEILWKAMETNQCFTTRSEASAVSKAAAQNSGIPSDPGG